MVDRTRSSFISAVIHFHRNESWWSISFFQMPCPPRGRARYLAFSMSAVQSFIRIGPKLKLYTCCARKQPVCRRSTRRSKALNVGNGSLRALPSPRRSVLNARPTRGRRRCEQVFQCRCHGARQRHRRLSLTLSFLSRCSRNKAQRGCNEPHSTTLIGCPRGHRTAPLIGVGRRLVVAAQL